MALPVEGAGAQTWTAQPLIRTLLLDDSSFDRARIKRMSCNADLGVDLTEVRDIAQMKEAVAQTRFELILIDYRLPEGDGLEVLAHIQGSELNSEAALIMITGSGDMHTAVTAMRLGCHDFLTKDNMTPAQLRTAVKGAMQSAQAARERAQQAAHQREVIRNGLTDALMQPCVQKTVVALFRDEVLRTLGPNHAKQDQSAMEAQIIALQDEDDTFIFD